MAHGVRCTRVATDNVTARRRNPANDPLGDRSWRIFAGGARFLFHFKTPQARNGRANGVPPSPAGAQTTGNKMSEEKKSPFSPGAGVDIVFNINALSPIVRSSIIFDFDAATGKMAVSQPTPRVLPGFRWSEMHVTTLTKKTGGDTMRLGLSCAIEKFVEDYKLFGKSTTQAILLSCTQPIKELNVRSAYRLHPTPTYNIAGKMLHRKETYNSGKDFRIDNVSVAGIGMVIPKKVGGKLNPLLTLGRGARSRIGLVLLHHSNSPFTFACTVIVRRVNTNYSDVSGFLGLQFVDIKEAEEHLLAKFIHEAQLHSIRQISGL